MGHTSIHIQNFWFLQIEGHVCLFFFFQSGNLKAENGLIKKINLAAEQKYLEQEAKYVLKKICNEEQYLNP